MEITLRSYVKDVQIPPGQSQSKRYRVKTALFSTESENFSFLPVVNKLSTSTKILAFNPLSMRLCIFLSKKMNRVTMTFNSSGKAKLVFDVGC